MFRPSRPHGRTFGQLNTSRTVVPSTVSTLSCPLGSRAMPSGGLDAHLEGRDDVVVVGEVPRIAVDVGGEVAVGRPGRIRRPRRREGGRGGVGGDRRHEDGDQRNETRERPTHGVSAPTPPADRGRPTTAGRVWTAPPPLRLKMSSRYRQGVRHDRRAVVSRAGGRGSGGRGQPVRRASSVIAGPWTCSRSSTITSIVAKPLRRNASNSPSRVIQLEVGALPPQKPACSNASR